LPTLAELCGIQPPDVQLDGQSLAAVVRNPDDTSLHTQRLLHWQVGAGPNAEWALREGDWKLIGNTRDTSQGGRAERISLFLVNLQDDPGEHTNLAEQHPDIVARLQRLHEEHLE
jgi:arylsulfatase A-like enzyme